MPIARIRYRRRELLSITQERVLQALSYGGLLTETQIRLAAGLTAWRTRQSVAELARRGLITSGARPGRYEITRAGRNTLTSNLSRARRSSGGL
ncbi:hypothetical protein [Nocardia vermiculata]|uniref:HTH marR-type domain-containing protein n=1 Tax=Nocardia vermiculata TaxID=257274 RepID=A0A846XQL7_9NOCA|nr:hypothetical protein [Nocardia vermiculata]NKY48907.1 hypothetical protein [Nocardia vermiculata]